MSLRKFLLNVLEKTIIGFSIFVLYSSVLVGILFPMLLIGGLFMFLKIFFWISWYLADPTILSKDIITSWLNSYLHIPFFSSDIWLYLKVIIFIIGLILFISSLIYLVIGFKKKMGIIQESVYKYIRHPQNVSIIIMAFPLFFIGGGFRMGDIVSWVQFIFIMIIYSDIGDIKLKKKYPEEFQLYYENSGLIFPSVLSYRISFYFSAVYNKKLRYPLLLSIYILCIYMLYHLFLVLPFTWIVM
ncbi:hypothetical protein LCGC14_1152480 [marine sediment metagenome]|uniref:Uncharacterized protein n=1 Tax=marine sediment metagenome TaxID=412755 RepID=A0A0F9LZZ0_9ZZZZ|nr:hypothetical protein [bacterium]